MGDHFGNEIGAGFSSRELRDALGCFATGITIVTAHMPGYKPIGLTVNSFASVSLEPPLVLWSLDRNSENVTPFLQADHFGVNVLEESQEHLSTRFATRGMHGFKDGEFQTWETGAPILPETLAQFDCRIVERFDGGDHVIFLGKVVRISSRPGNPLLYSRGGYRGLDNSQAD